MEINNEGPEIYFKFYQTGFCKFKEKCLKRHENQICQVQPQCTNKECEKRHPKMCRNFSAKRECSHNEKCAYSHQQPDNLQLKFNETVLTLISRNQQEIETLKEEVKKLENKIENIVRNNKIEDQQGKSSEDIEEQIDSDIQDNAISKDVLKCDLCRYQCKKKATLQKHKNTKHGFQNGTSGTKNKFYCDECSSAFTTKKAVKTHKKKDHETIKCEKCKLTFEKKNELNSHMKKQHLEDNENQTPVSARQKVFVTHV